jgi:DnaK suppressor protein
MLAPQFSWNKSKRMTGSGHAEISSNRGGIMTNAETKHLEVALQAKRQEIASKICGRVGDLGIGAGEGDILDRIQSMAERDETAAMLSRLSSTLVDIDRSLRAMSEGSYGVCTRCGEPIAIKRLQVIPWAAYCVRCQERFESANECTRSKFYGGEAA